MFYLLDDSYTSEQIELIAKSSFPKKLERAKRLFEKDLYEKTVLEYALLKLIIFESKHIVITDETKLIISKNKTTIEGLDINISLSHSSSACIASITSDKCAVIIKDNIKPKEKMLTNILNNEEISWFNQDNDLFYYYYTNKEAYIKFKKDNINYSDIDLSYFSSDLFRYKDLNFFYKNYDKYSLSIVSDKTIYDETNITKISISALISKLLMIK